MAAMDKRTTRRPSPSHHEHEGRVFLYLVAFRIANAFLLQTFFQPDEYFQSLEPAWQIAFGPDNGAWITWEWRERLRSSIHPYIFAAVYMLTARLADALQVGPSMRADMLLAGPKALQAIFAALMDWYIWRLARKVHGKDSGVGRAALYLSVFSPWQWFVSTRTLMNSLESTLTAAALYHWPWEVFCVRDASVVGSSLRRSLRTALCLAATGSILRAPSIIVWIVVAVSCVGQCIPSLDKERSRRIVLILLRETVVCGLVILTITVVADRTYYGVWALPPLRFLQFNVVQSLAVFYGRNRPDYYLTEGLPLLLTTALPFAVYAIYRILFRALQQSGATGAAAGNGLKTVFTRTSVAVVFATVTTLSGIPHKEVRFLYPLLPMLTVLAAKEAADFFRPATGSARKLRRVLLYTILVFNVSLAGYISVVHQRGVIDVTRYLRREYEHRSVPDPATEGGRQQSHTAAEGRGPVISVGFLMPCHSTPWRSHLVHKKIDAWALGCEPPLNLDVAARTTYLDEADQFYADPEKWLGDHLIERADSGVAGGSRSGVVEGDHRTWPEYLVVFEQLEPSIRGQVARRNYAECWRGFNSHFHDDWRRRGDVIVLCLQQQQQQQHQQGSKQARTR